MKSISTSIINFCFLFFLTVLSFHTDAQYILHSTDFENSSGFLGYSPSQQNNLWQIGPTTKSFFGSANTLPNAIMTDTVNFYPVNSMSSFIFNLRGTSGVNLNTWIDFDHKYQTIAGRDGGAIEVSYDSINWQNILIDTTFANYSLCFTGPTPGVSNLYSVSDTLFNGQPGFSGQSSGWIHSGIFWCWIMSMNAPEINIPPDNMWIRFTFYSDSVADSLDGWIIDNLTISYDNPGSIFEYGVTNNSMTIFPQPAANSIKVKFTDNETPESYFIYSVTGQIIKTGIIENDSSISVDNLSSGYYILKVRSKSKHEFIHSLVIE